MKFATFAIAALLLTPASVHAAAKTCLTGTDASVAVDPAQIAAVRESVDATCSCSSFDGSKGHKHADYVKCAKGVIADAVTASNLRKQCKGTVTTYYSLSTCGTVTTPPVAPCITTNAKGIAKCAIKPTTKCKGTACPDFTTCIDAADTNGDGLIGAGDSGACATSPTQPPSNSTPTATATPTAANMPPPPAPTNTPISGPPMNFAASLDGTQAGTASTATGSCTGTLDGSQTSFSIMCTHDVVSPSAAHIHAGAPGVAGPIVFPFSSPASPINAMWMGMTPTDVANLMAGNLYVNIHSNNCGACGGGEIRGQLLSSP
jgi:hypothetical protein